MGLLSPGGVHAHQDHMAALAKVVAEAGVPVAVHGFTDGRDTPPAAGQGYLAEFLEAIGGTAGLRVPPVDGPHNPMTRHKPRERARPALRAIAGTTAKHRVGH